MKLIEKAIKFLENNGYVISESSIKGDFAKGEKGGEPYYNLSNDYTYSQARRYFLEAIYGTGYSDEELEELWNYRARSVRKNQFEKTYAQFEKYRKGEPVKLYRGLILSKDKNIDLDQAGECWSFSRTVPVRWVDGIWDNMVHNHIMNDEELEDCDKYILTAETPLENCRLPYSFWLAGRFERPEWEVRIKNEDKVKIIKSKKIGE